VDLQPRRTSPMTSSGELHPLLVFQPSDPDPMGKNRSLTDSVRIDLSRHIFFKSDGACS
jgi:hypothetical protein